MKNIVTGIAGQWAGGWQKNIQKRKTDTLSPVGRGIFHPMRVGSSPRGHLLPWQREPGVPSGWCGQRYGIKGHERGQRGACNLTAITHQTCFLHTSAQASSPLTASPRDPHPSCIHSYLDHKLIFFLSRGKSTLRVEVFTR